VPTLISAAINAPNTIDLIAVSPRYVVIDNNCDHPDSLAQGLHWHAGNPVADCPLRPGLITKSPIDWV
jgi:hypothetical protein